MICNGLDMGGISAGIGLMGKVAKKMK